MSTKRPRYSERTPWMPTPRQLAHHIGRGHALNVHREESGAHWWWSDGCALFRGSPPDYLRAAYRRAGQPVDAPLAEISAATIASARNAPAATALGEPVASYEANGRHLPPVPVDVFAASDSGAPEIHVDARYVTHARRTFPSCTFWRGDDGSTVVVRDRDGALVGIIQRRAPDAPRPRRRRGAA